MAQEVTLGGDRVGSGNKQKVELHNYGMNSFNLEQDWKSSMAPGVLYPFLKLVGTNHGTFDIDLDSFIRTIPTQGPLFGSFKFQLDVYSVPIRLYQGILHNNPVGIGLSMNQVYLPKLKITTKDGGNSPRPEGSTDYNFQINESSLAKYLGLSGIGRSSQQQSVANISRKINAIPFLAYYDIFKCYYSNKQEEDAYVITPGNVGDKKPILKRVGYSPDGEKETSFPYAYKEYMEFNPYDGQNLAIEVDTTDFAHIDIAILLPKGYKTEDITQDLIDEGAENIYFNHGAAEGNLLEMRDDEGYITFTNEIWEDTETRQKLLWYRVDVADPQGLATYLEMATTPANITITCTWDLYRFASNIKIQSFNLKNIDDMRNALLSANTMGSEFVLGTSWTTSSGTDETGLPYSALFKTTDSGITWNAFTMNGLVLKTYQSDLFNNWLDTEFIDGENGISAISAVDTQSGKFTMDSLNLSEKIYELLNRVLVSGGTYEDWQEAVYGEGAVRKAETPMYVGGMAAEIMFEEVISNSETNVENNFQALGSLAGKGTQVGKRGGNNIHIKCDEPSYIIGIASITPRICYSQGNDWDLTELDTLDDLHKPALDGIGFQELMIEQMAWWNTIITAGTSGIASRQSAGKQTAWINYQTAVDKCYGDFAKQDGFSFMVLNRNYEMDLSTSVQKVKDLTTYIDPSKYNYAFAYQGLDAQNFWVQIHSKVIARRKMGAQQIPNL